MWKLGTPVNLLRVLTAVAVMTALLSTATVERAAATDPGTEGEFGARINSLRESHGLAPLQVHVQVTGVARRWTDRMAGAGQISHNPNLANDVQGNWTKLGENVGVGRDVDGLMRAFINSPAHYANLVDPSFNYVGVGVTFAPDGHLFTTHDFMALDDQPVPAPAPQAFAPSPPSAPTPDAVPPATPAVPTPASPQRVSIMLRALRDVER